MSVDRDAPGSSPGASPQPDRGGGLSARERAALEHENRLSAARAADRIEWIRRELRGIASALRKLGRR
jgi:hypothetical protein